MGCDVADAADVDDAVGEIVERFGGIDIARDLCAAKVKVQPFAETSLGRWSGCGASAILGVAQTMQACRPYLRERRGKVINFGSGAGIGAGVGYAPTDRSRRPCAPYPHQRPRSGGPYGVHVNAICPFAKSDQFDEWAAAYPEQAQMAVSSSSLGRIGDCELDIGRAAVFLASDDASYITGHSLMVDGGQGMPL